MSICLMSSSCQPCGTANRSPGARIWRRRVLFCLLIAWLAGCAVAPRPDLARLYEGTRNTTDQPPVILIHGVMGARLQDQATGREVWLGPLTRFLTSQYRELALPIDPDTLEPKVTAVRPSHLADVYAGRDFYRSIIECLETAGGYRHFEPGQATNGERAYYIFLYDWRQDNQKTAAKLSRFIEQVRLDHADPQLKVDVIAHSMGGLIARYYLRYGETDVLNSNDFPMNLHGTKRVRMVILLGTPNLGSMDSVRSFITGRRLGFRRIPPDVLATMPSLYQLFPHSINDWLVTTEGKVLQRDVFDVEIWRRFQWSIFDPKTIAGIRAQFDHPAEADAYLATLEAYFHKHLERARRFVWSLTLPMAETVPLIVFGGDCALTPARLVVEEVKGESVLRLWPKEIANPVPNVDYEALMLEPGDGTVTKASLLARDVLDPSVQRHEYSFFPLDYAFFLCEPHDSLTGNVSFQDNLLHALLSQD